jgi:hypothetical protein
MMLPVAISQFGSKANSFPPNVKEKILTALQAMPGLIW